MDFFEQYSTYTKKFDHLLDASKKNKLDRYFEMLTSRAMERGFIGEGPVELLWQRHILDSLIIMQKPEVIELLRNAKSAIDLGSGAGLPGIPLAIIFPDTKFVLVESMSKRCQFLAEVVEELGLENIEIINKRMEDVTSRQPGDIGLASQQIILFRAFLKPLVSLELALHIATQNSKILYWRSRRFESSGIPEQSVGPVQKLVQARLREMGYRVNNFFSLECPPDLNSRGIYIIEYSGKTDRKFPRRWSLIKKDQLCNEVI